MLNVEENDNKIEDEIPITPIMFVLLLFASMLSWVFIFLYLFVMLVLLWCVVVSVVSNKK